MPMLGHRRRSLLPCLSVGEANPTFAFAYQARLPPAVAELAMEVSWLSELRPSADEGS
jgi:hypothetical protein